MVGVEDLWFTAILSRDLQTNEAEFCLEAVRSLPAKHSLGEQFHDRHRVEQTPLQRDAGDVGRPGMFRCSLLLEVYHTGELQRWVSLNCGT